MAESSPSSPSPPPPPPPPAAPTEFKCFPRLPTELRLMVWANVPQPTRVIGQLPCHRCMSDERNETMHTCAIARHADWRLRYVVQPRSLAIFPPLHACAESRRAWLPRYFRPPRYINLAEYDRATPIATPYNLRFDMPFISYEADVFAIFNPWTSDDICDEAYRPNGGYTNFSFDPFLGLDRSRIRRAALCEMYGRYVDAIHELDIQTLPALRNLSLIASGPDPDIDHRAAFHWLEMSELDIARTDCRLRDVPTAALNAHPFFNDHRLLIHGVDPPPNHQPLAGQLRELAAWMWHATRWDARHARSVEYLGDGFFTYVNDDDCADEDCPLEEIDGCGPGGHTRQEMLDWQPPWEMDAKVLCEVGWLERLEEAGVFEDTADGNHDRFLTLEALERARPFTPRSPPDGDDEDGPGEYRFVRVLLAQLD
ncbi:hypothetical protein B0T19DRAFT_438334 [Cercophora scortea]|uniref:2EXR domain-containing protein n=1 Tax=Cercophora scortea TaxID=314031 RepID=A0AAE0J665_9PEZI|nr:hypothetical protein B0T19DRAFT_438334 [Cercophora scortea]